MLISRRELMLSESKQMNSIPICGMHSNSIFRSFYIYISTILRTTYDPFNILKTLLKAKKKKRNLDAQNITKFSTRTKKKKKKTIVLQLQQHLTNRSQSGAKIRKRTDLTGRIIERTLNQVFHPFVVNRMVTSKRLSSTACAYYVCVSLHRTKRAYVCSRVCDREYAALRACINSFQLGVPVGGGGGCVRARVCVGGILGRVCVCRCVRVSKSELGATEKGSRGTITEPRFRATTRRHPFNLHPRSVFPNPTGNPPLLLHLLLFFASSSSRFTCRGITAASLAKRTKT